MSKALADRVHEFLQRESTCPNFKKRSPDLACVGNAAQNLVVNAQPGGAFHDLLLLKGPAPLFADPGVRQAINTLVQFVLAYAPELQLPPEAATTLAPIIFAVVWEYYIGGHDISTNNVIPASVLSTPPVSQKPSQCSTATAEICNVGCSMIGPIQSCSTDCSSTTTGCGATGTIKTTAFIGVQTGHERFILPTAVQEAKPYCTP